MGADLLGHRRAAQALGAANAVVGGYLGSYTGVLLASTAVPVWARSRLFLGPIFVSTATLTGASATRLALVATGMPDGHPTREALGRVESGAMAAELLLSEINQHRLGRLAHAFRDGRSGALVHARRSGWRAPGWRCASPAAVAAPGPTTSPAAASWPPPCASASRGCSAGPISAADDEAVARTARGMAREP